jgi:dihydroorotate dehydrogenase
MGGYERLLRPALFRACGGDAERIHERTLHLISSLGRTGPAPARVASLGRRRAAPVTVAGVRFPNRVGLAAGMDKDGVAVAAWQALGFGHVELGTVTTRPQRGNDRPRLFRLPASEALINRMGFNNAGAAALAERLEKAGVRRGNRAAGIPVGISIGKSRATPLDDATQDYLTAFSLLAPYADYVAINVSSPNTPGLRTLQDAASLRELAARLVSAAEATAAPPSRERDQGQPPVPIFVKIAPDLTDPALAQLLGVVTDAGVQGLIATNTTLARDGVAPPDLDTARQSGGLSGAPLARRAQEVVRFLRQHSDLPIIGVGGICSRADGQAMLDAGADLLQVYTGFVYHGPRLVAELAGLRRDASAVGGTDDTELR